MSGLLLEKVPAAGRKETDEHVAALRAVIRQFRDMVTKVVFPGNIADGVVGTYKAVTETVQDANSVRMYFGDNKIRRIKVKVKAAGTTATGISLRSVAGVVVTSQTATMIVSFTEGQATLDVGCTGAGDVVLQLEDLDATGLTVSDEITVTFA